MHELSIESVTFATGGTRTTFAALFGELVLHPRPAPLSDLSEDAYMLFYGRSAALGWLTPAVEGASGGIRGLNDAEVGPGPGPQPQRVAWFQVVLTEPAPGGNTAGSGTPVVCGRRGGASRHAAPGGRSGLAA